MTALHDWLNKQSMRNHRGGKLTYNSVNHMLKNRRYIGEYLYHDIVNPDGMPASVPLELFDHVQAKMEKNKKAPARHKAKDDYLLTTKIFCGYCGAYICGESGTSHTGCVHRYYKCASVKKRRKVCHKSQSIKIGLKILVVHKTMEFVMDDEFIEAVVSMVMRLQEQENVNLPICEKQLEETERGIQNVLNAIQQGILTRSTKERLESLEAAKDDLETKIVGLQ